MKNISDPGHEAFGIFLDNLYPISVDEMRMRINQFAIFNECILVSDSFLCSNSRLQRLLQTSYGQELLKNGIIVPLLRDNVSSFGELALSQKQTLTGYCATTDFMAMIDQIAHLRAFPLKLVASTYTEMSGRLLQPEILSKFGISEIGIYNSLNAIRAAKLDGTFKPTNSFFYDNIKPLMSGKEGVKMLELIRAPYRLNLPSLLKTSIAAHQDFNSNEIIAALRGNMRRMTTIGLAEAVKEVKVPYRSQINDPVINWLMSKKTLASMTVEDLILIRSSGSRDQYLQWRTKFSMAESKQNWEVLTTKMKAYLHVAGMELLRRYSNRNEIHEDPKEGALNLEGDSSLRLIGDTSTIPTLQLVGSTFNLPDLESPNPNPQHTTASPGEEPGNEPESSSAKAMAEIEQLKKGMRYTRNYSAC